MTGIAQEYKFAYAQKLRAKPTLSEQKVWKRLRNGVCGLRFYRQIVIRGYIVDFYCYKVRLAIELDGETHNVNRDSARDAHLEQAGVTVLRFKNPTSKLDVNTIFGRIYAECRWRSRRDYSTYPPLSSFQPQGETREEKTWGKPQVIQGCQRQAYASLEVAENAARLLRTAGREAAVGRCAECKLIHVTEPQ